LIIDVNLKFLFFIYSDTKVFSSIYTIGCVQALI